jgi:hypothetical protein
MIASFDVFKIDMDGHVLWCDQAASLQEAKAKVRRLALSEKAEYVIFNENNGNRLFIEVDRASTIG